MNPTKQLYLFLTACGGSPTECLRYVKKNQQSMAGKGPPRRCSAPMRTGSHSVRPKATKNAPEKKFGAG